MKKKLLVGLAAAALAVIPMTAATADNHENTDVYVVHAFPGPDVDVYVYGAGDERPEDPALAGFAPQDVEGPVSLPAGTYTVDITAPGEDDALLSQDLDVPGGVNVTVVAHPTGEGELAVTAFVNDMSDIACGEARVEVRHTAQAPEVFLSTGDTELGSISLGEVFAADVPAGDLPVTVALEDGTELIDTSLPLADSSYTILHAFFEDGELSVIPLGLELDCTEAEEEAEADEETEEMEAPAAEHSPGEAGLASTALPVWVIALMALGALSLVVPAVARKRN